MESDDESWYVTTPKLNNSLIGIESLGGKRWVNHAFMKKIFSL